MKKEFVRQVVVFENHFKEFRKTLNFNGFQKKTQKTPAEQLDKAEALMKKYYDQKSNRTNG